MTLSPGKDSVNLNNKVHRPVRYYIFFFILVLVVKSNFFMKLTKIIFIFSDKQLYA